MKGTFLVAAALLMFPAADAHAGVVTISNGVLHYDDNDGQRDVVSIRRDIGNPDQITVMKGFGGTAISESSASCTLSDPTVTCTGANALTRVVVSTGAGADQVDLSDLGYTGEVHLGPGDDVAGVVDQDRPFVDELHGDDGADNLFGGNGNDTLDGGGDSDYLQGRGGADDIGGGAGFDFVDYFAEPGRTGHVEVSLDDLANDGNPGVNEKDNVHSDVEDVSGTTGNDVLIGSAASNVLYGYDGDDHIVGGAGVDVLFGLDGDDLLEARDGLGERVDCNKGIDTAIVDDNDSPNSCESLDSSPEQIPDRDGDGISKPADCNDADDRIKPGAFDVPDNQIDENCDGVDAVDLDRDRDGATRPQDCDDTQASRHPGATDVPGNKVDENCDGVDAAYPEFRPAVTFFTAAAGARTRFRKLTVSGLARDDVVELTCPTKRCKIKPRTVTARRASLELNSRVKGRHPKGTVIVLTISRAGFASSIVRLTLGRSGATPKLKRLCQPPDAAKPQACRSG